MLFHQFCKQAFERDAMQRIVGFWLVHECILAGNIVGSIADCDSFGCSEFAGMQNNVEIRLLRTQSADKFIFAQQPQIKIKWPSPKTQRSKPRRHRQKRPSKRKRRSRPRNRAESKKPLLYAGSTSFEPYSTASAVLFLYTAPALISATPCPRNELVILKCPADDLHRVGCADFCRMLNSARSITTRHLF